MEENKTYDYIIIGGGIIGVSIGYKLSLKYPERSILIIEKENRLAYHQTGRNSGVIHSGIYYKPNSLKAKNCINGRRQLLDFAKQYNITYNLCGKLIVATNEKELETLKKIYKNGLENGLNEIQLLNAEESKKYEPYAVCIQSIYVPYTGIIDYVGFTKQMAALITHFDQNKILLSCQAIKTINETSLKKVVTSKGVFRGKYVVFAAGLQSDEMAEKDGVPMDSRIIGFRGDYYNIVNKGKDKVKTLIYPVPNIELPFLGVHLTTMHDGSIEAGPNAVLSFKKEGYKLTSFNLKDTLRAFLFVGYWRLLYNYWKIGLNEYWRAFSKKRFLKSLQDLVPSLEKTEIKRGKSGVRAQALNSKGELIDDFLIKKSERSLHVINAPSPAATASLAIADEVLLRLDEI